MKEKLVSAGSGVCGGMSILGSYQLCHNICIGIIALLTLFGITVTGMPLMFLTKVALPFWIAALALLVISLVLVFGFNMRLSKKMILANSGLIVAGTPFAQNYQIFFWIAGGILVAISIFWAFLGRKRR